MPRTGTETDSPTADSQKRRADWEGPESVNPWSELRSIISQKRSENEQRMLDIYGTLPKGPYGQKPGLP